MGRGRASALKNYALTYKCQKFIFFKYSRVIHQKKRLEPLMNEQNIENCGRNGQKKTLKIPLSAILTFFDSFLAITSAIFNILKSKRLFPPTLFV